MKTTYLNSVLKFGVGLLLTSSYLSALDFEAGKNVVETKCIACHTGDLQSGLSRISEQRKTPEGWFMTVSRMERLNGLVLTPNEKKSVIKYLADTQGLYPKETEAYRYIIEKTPNYQEKGHDAFFTEMCNRCHSAARIGLQRRTPAEWANLVEFHMGHIPSIDYHALSRDRNWYNLAKEKMVPYLSKNFSLDKKFIKEDANYAGTWILYGHRLGAGDFTATMKAEKISTDEYNLSIKGKYLDGREFSATGSSIVYSGYEWRASLDLDGIDTRQIFKMDSKTSTLSGSMFERAHFEEHSFISGVKQSDKKVTILGVYPKSVKAGTNEVITISGNNLDGKIELSSALKVNKILEQSPNKIVLDVTASSKYDSKLIDIKIGSSSFKDKLVVYKKLDGLKVFPSYAIARVGDGGGTIPKQHSIFEAYGYLAGKDGKMGTADDISIGKVDAKWSLAPFDERSKEDQDIKYIGTIDSYSGRFIPSFAGPNPKRKFSTNNAGNVKVIATYKEKNETFKADSHMIVTVQKWVNPPIE